MFGELPKLFDRNFAMAYFLPMVVFIGIVAEIIRRFIPGTNIVADLEASLIVGATLLVVTAWLGGILLLVTNRGLYRFLEGYGRWNPLKLLLGLEKKSYKKLVDEIAILDDQYLACLEAKQEFPQEARAKRNKAMEQLAERFPEEESLLLPTPFGNTLRAFEGYPKVMYGMDSIQGWSRLLAVIPKDYRDLMDNAKAQVDFWINVGFLSFLLLLEYVGLAVYHRSVGDWWLALIILLTVIISPYFARNSAVEWGDFVKGAFDVFAPKLREALGIPMPKDREEEKEQWTAFSQAIIYRLPERVPEFKQEEEEPTPEKGSFFSWLFKK